MAQETRPAAPPRFLRDSFHRNSACYLRRVPLAVLVDDILLQLSLADILSLRMVDKAFFILTHEVTIWKHFFWQLDMPTPFFYENPCRFTIDPREFDCERLVARSIMVEDNWRSTYTRAVHVDTFAFNFEIMEMKVMPGGKYIVASATRWLSPDVPREDFLIVVQLCGPPGHITPKLLLCLNTGTRVYRLQARFMLLGGQQSLAIAFVTRRYKRGYEDSLDLTEYEYEENIDARIDYWWHCGGISIADLELADSTVLDNWRHIATHAHDKRIDCLVLGMQNDTPIAAFIEQPNKLMIYNLDTYGSEGMPFHSPSPNTWIRSLRLLTSQNRVMVIRTWRIQGGYVGGVDQHYVEVYDYINTAIPQPPVIFVPLHRDGRYTSFMISEPTQMTEFPANAPFPRAKNIPSHHLHPPISVYAMRQNPRSLEHYLIWALDADSVSPTYQVQSSCFIPTSRYIYETLKGDVELIPAVHRPLVYNSHPYREWGVVTDLRRYLPRQTSLERAPYDGKASFERAPLVRRSWHETWQPTRALNSIGLIPDNVFSVFNDASTYCVGWDETSGRVCVCTGPPWKMTLVDMGRDIQRSRYLDIWRDQGRSVCF